MGAHTPIYIHPYWLNLEKHMGYTEAERVFSPNKKRKKIDNIFSIYYARVFFTDLKPTSGKLSSTQKKK